MAPAGLPSIVLATAAQALTGRPADTTQELRPYFPTKPITDCYAAESHARAFADGSGASLSSFTAFASVKASGCRKAQPGAYGYNSTAPWYARGCSLLNAVAATVDNRTQKLEAELSATRKELAEMRAMLQLLVDKGEERHGLLRRLID